MPTVQSPLSPTIPVLPPTEPSPTPARPKRLRIVLWIVGVIAVVIVVVLVDLATVPIGRQASFQTQIPTPAKGLFECSGATGPGQTFPAGKTIYVSWTTTPSESVTVTAIAVQTTSVVFSGSGASGNGTFDSLGEEIQFGTGNCGIATTVSLYVYYYYVAPIL